MSTERVYDKGKLFSRVLLAVAWAWLLAATACGSTPTPAAPTAAPAVASSPAPGAPTLTVTPAPKATDTPTPTVTPTPTNTPQPTSTPVPASTPTSTETPTPMPTAGAEINVATLNVRGGPGTEYEKIGLLQKGDGVWVLGQTANGWYEVRWEKDGEVYEGWITGDPSLVNANEQAQSAPIVEETPPPPEPTPTPEATKTLQELEQERFEKAKADVENWWSRVNTDYTSANNPYGLMSLTDTDKYFIGLSLDTIAWANRIPIDDLVLSTGQSAVEWARQKKIIIVEENGKHYLDLTHKVTSVGNVFRRDLGDMYGQAGRIGGKRTILISDRVVDNLRDDYGRDLNDQQVAVLIVETLLKEGLEAEYYSRGGNDVEHTRLDISVYVCELLANEYDDKDPRLAKALRDMANLLRNWQER